MTSFNRNVLVACSLLSLPAALAVGRWRSPAFLEVSNQMLWPATANTVGACLILVSSPPDLR